MWRVIVFYRYLDDAGSGGYSKFQRHPLEPGFVKALL